MDWLLIDWYQGTDDSSDPSIATVQVYYLERAICYETMCDVPVALVKDSSDWNDFLEVIAQSVLECCSSSQPNPNYDPSLTACWT